MTSLVALPMMLFIFAPAVVTCALVASIAWWKTRSDKPADAASGILAAAVRTMSPERAEWGQAMLAELEHLQGRWSRLRFAIGCARVALFPPAASASLHRQIRGERKVVNCGMLSVALPSLALPFLYFAAFAADALFHGSGGSTSHAMPAGMVGACLTIGLAMLLSGLPLGLAGWYRAERFLWLSALGPCLSMVFVGYLWLFLYFFAVGPNGD